MSNPKLNSSGYRDLTAYEAIKKADKTDDLVNGLIKTVKSLVDICGFEVIGRIGLRSKVSGKEYR
jgi:hypothetical protein